MFSNRKKLKIQGKTTAHKKAMIKSQVVELIRNGRIKTTPKKARLLKSNFDKLVTTYKKDTTKSKQRVMAFFANNKRAMDRLSFVVETYLSDRNSGYTRVIKTLPRKGDNADQSYVMLVNFEPTAKKTKLEKKLAEKDKKETKSIGGRISSAVKSARGDRSGRQNVARTADVRRNSK